jgi:HNH endonuclease
MQCKITTECLACGVLFACKPKHYTRRFCSMKCYRDSRRHGLTYLTNYYRSHASDPDDKCWEWPFHLRKDGYADVRFEGKKQLVHRVSYRLFVGSVDDERKICHRCDNRSCFRSDHLFEGTQAENVRDAANKKRMRAPRGAANNHAKLSESQVAAIRREYQKGVLHHGSLYVGMKYGVSSSAVLNIVNGKSWRHLAQLGA